MKAIHQTLKLRMTALASGALAVAIAAASQNVFAQSAQQPGQDPSKQQSSQAQKDPAKEQSKQSQAGQSQSQQASSTTQQGQYQAVRTEDLLGKNVTNAQGQNLGKLEDLVVNANTGDVRYAILSFNPDILSQETLFAVPLRELKMNQGRDALVYQNMNKEKLAVAAIQRSEWAKQETNQGQETWGRIDRAYGIQQPTGAPSAVRVSQLQDKNIVAATGSEDLGDVESVVINMANQKVHYVVANLSRGWFTSERQVALPMTAFNVQGQKDDLQLRLNRQQATGLQPLDRNWQANMNDRTFVTDVDRYLVTVVTTSGGQAAQGPGQGQAAGQSASGSGGSQGSTDAMGASGSKGSSGASGSSTGASGSDQSSSSGASGGSGSSQGNSGAMGASGGSSKGASGASGGSGSSTGASGSNQSSSGASGSSSGAMGASGSSQGSSGGSGAQSGTGGTATMDLGSGSGSGSGSSSQGGGASTSGQGSSSGQRQ
ncbi:PRC-barrel domain-containing protein [Ramlibacter sp. AN1015]|uniref:PRC-barrel domain-containing protein n=1 Tax=Ramlibacter sp. AN1015 TaxID=3133428 RepID=UPI0030BDF155